MGKRHRKRIERGSIPLPPVSPLIAALEPASLPERPGDSKVAARRTIDAAAATGGVEASGARIDVRRTAKLFIGGAFPRSESGRTDALQLHGGGSANIARASRKDLREAVRVARAVAEPWASRSAMLRGQILYRVAELMEGRAAQFRDDLINHGASKSDAAAEVAAAVDRMVWYAGWPDKLAAVLGGTNPVASSHFVFTIPEPTGVVAAIAPEASPLLGLVSRLGGILAGGNVAIVVLLALVCVRACGLRRGYAQVAIVALVVAAYVVVARPQPSVVRAAGMTAVVLLALVTVAVARPAVTS